MASDRIYDLAFGFKSAKLWKKLSDWELFAVALPDGETGYCSIMGMMGEHFAISLYVGQPGYASFCSALKLASDPLTGNSIDMLTAQDCLQCAFVNKGMLSDEELSEVRDFAAGRGLHFRGQNAFPSFLKYMPGMFPRMPDEERDWERLGAAMEAAVWLKQRLTACTKEEIGLYDVRFNQKTIPMLVHDGEQWRVQQTQLPSAEVNWPKPVYGNEVLTARIRRMKKKGVWETGSFFFPSPVLDEEDEGPVPYYPLGLMSLDQSTGTVIRPAIGCMQNPEEIIRRYAEELAAGTWAPRLILAGDDRGYALLEDFCGKVGIELRREDSLQMLEKARDDLLRHVADSLKGNTDLQTQNTCVWSEDDAPDAAGTDRISDIQNELDQFCETLMKMRDEELEKMPQDLVKSLLSLADLDIMPSELVRRLRRLFP